MEDKRLYWRRSLFVTGLLIIGIAAASLIISDRINHMEEEQSFERLYQETDALAKDIETEAENDRQQLELLAAILSGYNMEASPEVFKILNSYSGSGIISRLELLLPDDTVLSRGEQIDAAGVLSFEEEAAKGVHISKRETDILDRETYIVRHYVPVIKDEEVAAMLYGVIILGELPDEMKAEPYGGEAAIYMIEGETGDFLVDTWHNEAGGNIWALGERKMAPGYNHEQLKQGLTNGETGYVVFVSETICERLYFYFEPLNINDWRVALSVPEDVVFSGAKAIRKVLNLFLLSEAVCFILYFLWMFRFVKKETGEKQRQLDTVNYIYDVEKLLFNAHEKKENITSALEKIGRMISARMVVLWFWEPEGESHSIQWMESGQDMRWDPEVQKESVRFFRQYFAQGNTQFEIKSLSAVPIKNMSGEFCGILAGYGLSGKRAALPLLKSVEFSFGMFCQNLQSYRSIKEQGEKDTLLGLYNRNRYEQDKKLYEEKKVETPLACVYIDVNGLHELNNRRGHDAGDEMLKKVSDQIRMIFGNEHAYRIGGDEFVVFIQNMDRETCNQMGKDFMENLEKKEIHVSMGLQWEEACISVDALIKSAEKKMYAAKKAYYEQDIHDRRKRDR